MQASGSIVEMDLEVCKSRGMACKSEKPRIERLTSEHDAELTAFLDGLGDSPLGAIVLGHHYPFYRDLLLEVLGPDVESLTFAARDDEGRVVGVLPGLLRKSGGIACYNSLPFFGANAGVLTDFARTDAIVIEAALTAATLEEMARVNAATSVFYSAFWPYAERVGSGPRSHPNAITIQRETVAMRLAPGTVWSPKIRYDLRKASVAGVTVVDGIAPEDVDEVFAIYAANVAALGIPLKPRAILAGLVAAQESGRVLAATARLRGEIVGALVLLRGPQTVSYYLPCQIAAHKSLQVGTVLVDHLSRRAAALGTRHWNWEGSPGPESGVRRFKMKWGSASMPYWLTIVPGPRVADVQAFDPAAIAARFPYFFVYPFSRLPPSPERGRP